MVFNFSCQLADGWLIQSLAFADQRFSADMETLPEKSKGWLTISPPSHRQPRVAWLFAFSISKNKLVHALLAMVTKPQDAIHCLEGQN